MSNKRIFQLGSIVITENLYFTIPAHEIHAAILKHASGEWGDVDGDRREENEIALLRGLKLLSVHHDSDDTEFRIVTAADRSATVVFLPHDLRMLAAEPPAGATACWADCCDGVEFSFEASCADLHPNDTDAAVALHEKTCSITANRHIWFRDITKQARRCLAASLCRGRDGIEFVVYTSRVGERPRIILADEDEAKGVYLRTDADMNASMADEIF